MKHTDVFLFTFAFIFVIALALGKCIVHGIYYLLLSNAHAYLFSDTLGVLPPAAQSQLLLPASM